MSRGLPLENTSVQKQTLLPQPPQKTSGQFFNEFQNSIYFSSSVLLFKLTGSCSSVQSTSVDIPHNFLDMSLQSSRGKCRPASSLIFLFDRPDRFITTDVFDVSPPLNRKKNRPSSCDRPVSAVT